MKQKTDEDYLMINFITVIGIFFILILVIKNLLTLSQ
jgi:hypothetical protein